MKCPNKKQGRGKVLIKKKEKEKENQLYSYIFSFYPLGMNENWVRRIITKGRTRGRMVDLNPRFPIRRRRNSLGNCREDKRESLDEIEFEAEQEVRWSPFKE